MMPFKSYQMLFDVFLLVLCLHCQRNVAGDVVAVEKEPVTLKCNHGAMPDDVQTIFWESRSSVMLAERFNGSLRNVHPTFLHRVNMSSPEGDLTIFSVDRKDMGYYKCITIQNGARAEPESWIQLTVYVKPENIRILCSGKTYGTPTEDCTDLKKDSIKSLKCEVVSNPKSMIVWSTLPVDCDINYSGSDGYMGSVYQQSSTLTNVCNGEYCCVAQYTWVKVNVAKTCFVVGTLPIGPKDASIVEHKNKKEENDEVSQGLIIGGVCVIVFLFIFIILVLIYLLVTRKRMKKGKPVKPDIPQPEINNDDDDSPLIKDTIIAPVNPNRYSQQESPFPQSEDVPDGLRTASSPHGEDEIDGGVDPFLERQVSSQSEPSSPSKVLRLSVYKKYHPTKENAIKEEPEPQSEGACAFPT